MDKIRVFTAFSGYDSQCLALDRLKRCYPQFDYELVGWSEIDKYAIQAHNALYPQWADRNFGDISKIDWDQVPDFDLFTYSSPCQDFSNAGLQRGGEEGSGTRSSLLWECRRAIIAKRPKYLLLENVKGILSRKNLPNFNKWQAVLADLGYKNYHAILNASDYGVAQNRPRLFMVSILNGEGFSFPRPIHLNTRLRDYLDPVFSVKNILLSKDFIRKKPDRDTPTVWQIGVTKETDWNRNQYRVYGIDGIAPCLHTCGGGGLAVKVLIHDLIRQLSPREYFKLMGVNTIAISKLLSTHLSDTQLRKLAGNSIVVDVLYHQFVKIFIDHTPEPFYQQTLF